MPARKAVQEARAARSGRAPPAARVAPTTPTTSAQPTTPAVPSAIQNPTSATPIVATSAAALQTAASKPNHAGLTGIQIFNLQQQTIAKNKGKHVSRGDSSSGSQHSGAPKETKQQYAARKALQAAERLAFLERQAKREERAKIHAENKAAWEERQARWEEQNAARKQEQAARKEEKAAKYREWQARRKAKWERDCVKENRCFNCGKPSLHKTADCPDPLWEGEYP